MSSEQKVNVLFLLGMKLWEEKQPWELEKNVSIWSEMLCPKVWIPYTLWVKIK